MRQSLNIEYARGGSMIISPAGVPIVGPVYGDTIIHANCPARMIKLAKAIIDTNGHYSRNDILTLNYHPREESPAPTGQIAMSMKGRCPATSNACPSD